MAFDPYSTDLPIREVLDDTKKHLATSNCLIVNAPPGAGKSTVLPLALLNEPWLSGQKILMLEPRRLAARSIAARMSDLNGTQVGKEIGYRVRFDNRVSEATKIEVVTEGILTRMLHSDNALEGVGLIIFDEFHERSIHADVALALCREAQQVLREDLRIVIMSATLDMPQLSDLLSSPTIASKGRQYPVDVLYTGENDLMMLPELTARTILQASREQPGDILAFFPGEGEIRKCEELLRKELKSFAIHPLYGQLPQNKQFAAIMPDKEGKRKIVLATSIAETSLTIEGITTVVDTGFARKSKFDPSSGLSKLVTVPVSIDAADQRAGRAGRLGPGVCYRMWTKATHAQLQAHRTPEIMEADLAPLVLDLAKWGIQNPNDLVWLDPPPSGALAQARNMLHEIEALEDDKLTQHGEELHKLPCHPRIAHMLIKAAEEDALALGTDIGALLEERDPLPKESGIDINLRLEELRRLRGENRLGKKFARIEKVAQSYRQLFKIEADNSPVDPFETGLLLCQAYPERIAHSRPGNNAQFQLANGKLAMVGHRDDLAHEPWLAVAHMDARDGMGKIFLAAPLNPRDLAPLVQEREMVTWDTRKGGLIASRDLRIGSIVLQSKPIDDPDEEEIKQAICKALIKEGEQLLNWSEHVIRWQAKVLSLRKWNPDEGWPDVSTRTLLANCEQWITPYLEGVETPEDLKKIDLSEVLHFSLAFDQQQLLDELTPNQIEVPSGSKIKLEYRTDGEAPFLKVRLQEMFGLAETPRINQGKTAVLLQLLSPGFKPVQITSDLKSFWNETYYEVRKDLKRRYPKHHWPDDPWIAEAVRGVKRKK
ncbi:ATP-dependent helicase HrpB [Marinoscillum furvescens]|uniref:ATP-dependent helicase HrpB n=1 Tax=Marinoscillum furvescens DSM 4134 TaxID=1122208 RepID=A0A3D9KY80_MARFU|nr:ATP-dependent helicase HrpB [Marinoscillum furvescens]RED94381.1 ATP-dependent helicase HrpB [Marinoscillum furvescens DSM 4134]